MEFNVMENEISEWLKDLKKVFEIIFKEKLLLKRERVDYEITLKIEKIKPSLLIFIRLKKQQIIKEYLTEIIKKE